MPSVAGVGAMESWACRSIHHNAGACLFLPEGSAYAPIHVIRLQASEMWLPRNTAYGHKRHGRWIVDDSVAVAAAAG